MQRKVLQVQIFTLSLVVFKVGMFGYLKCFVAGSAELYLLQKFFGGQEGKICVSLYGKSAKK